MKNLLLFGDSIDAKIDSDRPAPHNKTDTSIEAAIAIRILGNDLRRRVFEFIKARGTRGATNNEISISTGMLLQTVCARANELMHAGLIQKGMKRGGCRAWTVAVEVSTRGDQNNAVD